MAALEYFKVLPRSADPRLPCRQVGGVRQQGRAGKAARRARRSAGLGVGTDPADRRVRRGTALSAASGRGWHETLRLGEVATACAIRAVRGLDLRISPAKPQAIWFYDKNRRGTPPPGLRISMTGEAVGVGSRMKYLGLIIDSQWTFRRHFDSLVPKVSAAANVLCGCCRTSVGQESRCADCTRASFGCE